MLPSRVRPRTARISSISHGSGTVSQTILPTKRTPLKIQKYIAVQVMISGKIMFQRIAPRFGPSILPRYASLKKLLAFSTPSIPSPAQGNSPPLKIPTILYHRKLKQYAKITG
ncbi:hypothetical protein ES703_71323 [subsurface metagenome]